jgi:hypothetical protein
LKEISSHSGVVDVLSTGGCSGHSQADECRELHLHSTKNIFANNKKREYVKDAAYLGTYLFLFIRGQHVKNTPS